MPNFDNNNNPDHMADLWWATASGVPNWTDDYTRSRYGIETTYSGVDALIGRKDSIHDVTP